MDDLLSEVLDAERAVWAALRAGNADGYRAALAEDFLGVYPDGFFGRAAQLEAIAEGPVVADYALSEAQVRPVGDAHALLSYHARFRRPGRSDREAMRVSSLWRREAGGWINLFSQDTPEGEAVP